MAEATIKIDGIEVNIKSNIFSEKFMNLVKTIENFDQKRSNNKIQKNNSDLNSEPNDAVYYLTDIDLLENTVRILDICKKANIEKYYNFEDINPYVESYIEKRGFTNKNARKVLKDILRKCIDYAKTEEFKNQTLPNN